MQKNIATPKTNENHSQLQRKNAKIKITRWSCLISAKTRAPETAPTPPGLGRKRDGEPKLKCLFWDNAQRGPATFHNRERNGGQVWGPGIFRGARKGTGHNGDTAMGHRNGITQKGSNGAAHVGHV